MSSRRSSREKIDFAVPDPRLSIEFEIKRQGIEEEIHIQKESRRLAKSQELTAAPQPTPKQPQQKPPKRDTRCCAPCRRPEPEETIEVPDFHSIGLDALYQRLQVTSATAGLTAAEASSRLRLHGANIIAPPTPSLFFKLIGYLFSGFNLLLFGASILAWLAWRPFGGDNPDPINVGLAVVLIVVALISAGFNWYQVRAIPELCPKREKKNEKKNYRI